MCAQFVPARDLITGPIDYFSEFLKRASRYLKEHYMKDIYQVVNNEI